MSIMGGLKQEDGEWVADSAQNNVFDKAASAKVYGFCLQRCNTATQQKKYSVTECYKDSDTLSEAVIERE